MRRTQKLHYSSKIYHMTRHTLGKTLTFFLFICFFSFSEEHFCDLESLPVIRTKQYRLPKNKKILVYSAPRTGSSLIFNIFRYLFEDINNLKMIHHFYDAQRKVFKSHKLDEYTSYSKDQLLIVVPFRDPIKASISQSKMPKCQNTPLNELASKLINSQLNHLYSAMEMKKKEFQVIFYYYDEFKNNMTRFLAAIEKVFNINIHEKDKTILAESLSITNIQKAISHLKTFDEYLPYSGFHGNHINNLEEPLENSLILELEKQFEHHKKIYQKIYNQRFKIH